MQQKTILCYGDSNTWGYVPNNGDRALAIERYARNERWPGLLQQRLGASYHIVEEGLNGRTTNLDYPFPPDRNGKTYLPPCLYTHAPLDLVILALGGNDFKVYFNRDAKDIRHGLADLIDIIQAAPYGPNMQAVPKILLLPPGLPASSTETYVDPSGVPLYKGAIKKAAALIQECVQLSEEKDCYYLDISQSIFPSAIDGVHLDVQGHAQLAKLIADQVLTIFNKR